MRASTGLSTDPKRRAIGFKTWADRRSNLERHVVPRLGPIPLQDLTPDHLNRLYAELLRDGRVRQEGGLSPTSVRRIHAMLRKALNDAVRWGLLRRNVVTLADPPPARVEASAGGAACSRGAPASSAPSSS